KLIGRRQQPVAMAFAVRVAPFAGVVELSDDARPHVVAPVVELFLQLVFENLALFLDDDDLFQSLCEGAHAFRLERPRHAYLVEPDADVARSIFVDAEIGQRLARVEVGFAAGDDADARMWAVPYDAIQLVGTYVGKRGIPF